MSPRKITLSREMSRFLAVAGVAGAVTLAVGFVADPARAWSAYLVNAFYFLTLALGGLVFVALMHVSKAGWGVVVRRVAEGLSGYLPVGAASILAILVGMSSLYHWTHGEHDPALHAKAAYLNVPAFAIRMLVVLAIWLAFASFLRSSSAAQDRDGKVSHTHRNVAASALFLFTFAVSFSVASFDWIMSLEPHWASTIFAFYNMAGLLAAGIAALTVATIWLRRAGVLPEVDQNHLHDLGKLMFGTATFWAYLWISQYLLIWYSNMPEETAYYLARSGHGWGFLFYVNVAINWLVPFIALLPRPAKRNEDHLLRIAAVMLLGRWLDLYLMVAPASQPEHQGIGILEVVTFGGFAALFIFVVARALRSAPLVPRGDPYLVESLHHHQ